MTEILGCFSHLGSKSQTEFVDSGQVVAHGPILDLLPEDCTFGDAAAELSFDLRPLLGGYQGEALFCVLRQDPTVYRNGHAFRSVATSFCLDTPGCF